MESAIAGLRGHRLKVFCISAAALMLQLVQTRVFGVLFWNHLVYFIISIALLGYGLSGTWLAVEPVTRCRGWLSPARATIGFAWSAVVTTLIGGLLGIDLGSLMREAGQVPRLALIYVLAIMPYFFAGYLLGSMFQTHADDIHALYGADLAGATAACLLFLTLITPLGAVRLLALAALAGLVATPFPSAPPIPVSPALGDPDPLPSGGRRETPVSRMATEPSPTTAVAPDGRHDGEANGRCRAVPREHPVVHGVTVVALGIVFWQAPLIDRALIQPEPTKAFHALYAPRPATLAGPPSASGTDEIGPTGPAGAGATRVHEFSEWNAISRIDVAGTQENPWIKHVFIDGDAWTTITGSSRDFLSHFPDDLSAVTDDNPFFFNSERWSLLGRRLLALEFGDVIHGHWPSLILWTLLGLAAGAVAFLILLPRYWLARTDGSGSPAGGGLPAWSLYFVAIGVSYMFVEIALMQRFSLLLGHPSRSLACVLGTLLLGTGLGSAFGRRLGPRAFFPAIVAAIATALLLYPRLIQAMLAESLAWRSLGAIGLVLPIGFLLGMPFPHGIRQVSDRGAPAISWMWGVNGGATVLGSILAIVLAMIGGFNLVLGCALIGYLVAFLVTERRADGAIRSERQPSIHCPLS